MNRKHLICGAIAIAFVALLVAFPALADNPGQGSYGGGGGGGDASSVGSDFFDSLQSMITGNLGFFLGLLITVLGIWTWVIKQQTGAGVTMIIGGVLITLAPGLFNSARNLAYSALDTVGASDAGNDFTTNK